MKRIYGIILFQDVCIITTYTTVMVGGRNFGYYDSNCIGELIAIVVESIVERCHRRLMNMGEVCLDQCKLCTTTNLEMVQMVVY